MHDAVFALRIVLSAGRKPILNSDRAPIAAASRLMDFDIDLHQYRMRESGMLTRGRTAALTGAAIASLAMAGGVAGAQQTAAAGTALDAGPRIRDVAPDFTLAGATRYGLLKTPVRLSDYRGRTVVLAFFYQARTKG